MENILAESIILKTRIRVVKVALNAASDSTLILIADELTDFCRNSTCCHAIGEKISNTIRHQRVFWAPKGVERFPADDFNEQNA